MPSILAPLALALALCITAGAFSEKELEGRWETNCIFDKIIPKKHSIMETIFDSGHWRQTGQVWDDPGCVGTPLEVEFHGKYTVGPLLPTGAREMESTVLWPDGSEHLNYHIAKVAGKTLYLGIGSLSRADRDDMLENAYVFKRAP